MWILRSDWSHFNGELVFTLTWGGGGSFSKDSEQYRLTNACLLWWLHARDSTLIEVPLTSPRRSWMQGMGISLEGGDVSSPAVLFLLPLAFQLYHRRDICAVCSQPLINAVAANKKPSRKAWFVVITCDRIFLSCRPSHAISFLRGELVVNAGCVCNRQTQTTLGQLVGQHWNIKLL